ncbi:alpha/beta-hydrolase [Ceraceosorus guamensis]|uniref:Alpha/beta-hydrolase n=1 Tax=Ceraceosorus guamensis TaxID=1522189 RepID=A0A316VPB1_9BASI|nr:alpha/beta-hydrolase [Ceraceosorus guamensis]PWN39160.1 alpha/beta-hydrolase [Ceraceosorus guamensis]
MADFIDYSRRNRTPSPTDNAGQSHGQGDNNPFSDGGDVEHESGVAQQRPGGRGHHFDVEYQHTAAPEEGQHQASGTDNGAFFDPEFPEAAQADGDLEIVWFPHVVARYPSIGKIGKLRVQFRQTVSFGLTIGALGLVLVAAFAHYLNPFKKRRPHVGTDREYERRITGERLSGRPQYYSEFWGYRCDEHDIVTEGGWILKAHRISDPRRAGPPGHPVILQHGILCNSSHFFLCEERSMAFWLVDQGYDVWVTNIRANFNAGHTEYNDWDPRYWAWGLKELALDLRDVVEFISGATGSPRVAYVGHSQGSGSMYLALSPGICPELGNKLSSFTAIGPSVYAGPVLRKFPFSLMRQFRSRKWWSFVFGIREFIPAIGLFQKYLPAFWFGHLGYVVFHFLFGFSDTMWARRHKPKIFRSLPMPTSSELLYWYMASFSHRGCIFDPRVQEPWFPRTFPRHTVIGGSLDMLVLARPLFARLEKFERNVDIVHAVELEGYEHLDFIFGTDAYRTTYPLIHETIQSSLTDSERNPEMAERR